MFRAKFQKNIVQKIILQMGDIKHILIYIIKITKRLVVIPCRVQAP